MHATYDPEARAVAILLEDDARQDRQDEVAPGAIVGLRDGRPVEFELLGVGSADDVTRIGLAADRYGLDAPALIATLRAAVAVPGREVGVTVAARAA